MKLNRYYKCVLSKLSDEDLNYLLEKLVLSTPQSKSKLVRDAYHLATSSSKTGEEIVKLGKRYKDEPVSSNQDYMPPKLEDIEKSYEETGPAEEYESSLDKLLKTKPKHFNWSERSGASWFIAQAVKEGEPADTPKKKTLAQILREEPQFQKNQIVFDLRFGFGIVTQVDHINRTDRLVSVGYGELLLHEYWNGKNNSEDFYRTLFTKEEAEALGFICEASYPALVYDEHQRYCFVTETKYTTLEQAQNDVGISYSLKVVRLLTDVPELAYFASITRVKAPYVDPES